MRITYLQVAALSFLLIGFLASCKSEKSSNVDAEKPKPSVEKVQKLSVKFDDVTHDAGIRFLHNNGAFGKKYLPESMGSGCAFLDYDGDGWQDILLVNSSDFPEHKQKPSYMGLYRNNHDGTFQEVTKEAGLAIELYGIGVSAADYDNDSDIDVFISTLGPDKLFQNNGKGKFQDVSKASGIDDSDFGTSSTWFDYDHDGDLDLYVCNYVKWSPEKDLFCTLDGTHKSYCTPESYEGASPRLYENQGGGKFLDVSKKTGLYDPTSKALGVVAFDYNQDGWTDLFVANDTQPNKLYENKSGVFTEKGIQSGVAFSEAGVARAGMGVDAADYDGSGHYSLLIGNFSNEMLGLYHNEGTGLFIDEAPASTVGQLSLLTLTFGAFFFDFDLDGKTDIFAANGHVHDDIDKVQQQVKYAQPPHLFRNIGQKRFESASRLVGSDFQRPIVARGAAYGDIDNDGDLDLLITTNGGPAHLLRNDSATQKHFVKFKTQGSKSNRDGIGAKIIVHFNDGSQHSQVVKSGSSYCSQSELPVTFGLGDQKQIQSAEVLWPSGKRQKVGSLKVDQLNLITEN